MQPHAKARPRRRNLRHHHQLHHNQAQRAIPLRVPVGSLSLFLRTDDDADMCGRAGYKSAYGNTESYNSYRVPFAGEGYRVFVRPGVPCNTLCDRWQLGPYSCQEVAERPECI